MEQRASFGYWLRRRRKALDLTQHELARQVGCAVGTIQKLEGEERRPSRELAARLADLLQIPEEARAVFIGAARAELAADRLELSAPLPETPAPPPETTRPSTTNLPAHTTPLVGREHERAALGNLLRRDGVRLVTLTGPGGIGKTRLGLQAAADVREQFEDGVWLVHLTPVDDPGMVPAAIAHALGVRESGAAPILELLQADLRSKRILLLLDNFEQVVDGAPVVGALLAAAPGLKILATSRATLRISGEHEYVVPPLAVPPADAGHGSSDMPVTLEQYDAVRLFVECAQVVRPEWSLTAANAGAVAAICRRLDGLPLAIKLAAARVKLFAPETLLARLDRRLALLTGGPRDLPVRQQTMRATIDWSYGLLDEDEQTLFAYLGVFVGGWTLAAAEAVCDHPAGHSAVLDGLTSLADKSMIRVVVEPGGEPRFDMLELLREYALERLEQRRDGTAVRRRHAEHYAALAERWWQEDTGTAEGALFDQLDAEQENARAALSWSHTSQDDAALELRLIAALHQFFVVRGYAVEGWERLKAALLRAGAVPDPVRARALAAVGSALPHYQDDLVQTQTFIEEGLALEQRRGNQEGIAWQLMALGTATCLQGDDQRAVELFERSQALYQSLDDTWGQSVTQFALGQVALLHADLDRAEQLLERSLALCHASINTPWAIARRLTTIGAVALTRGERSRARALFAQSLTLSRDSQDKADVPLALVGMAGVARTEGQLERAAYLLGAAQALRERFGAYQGLTGAPWQAAITAATRAELDAATFDAAWTAGHTLTFDAALAAALSPPD